MPDGSEPATSEPVADRVAQGADPGHLASVLAIVAEAIIAVDPTQAIVFFNRGAERIFGYASDEVLGEPLGMLLPERYRAAHRKHVEAFARSSATAREMGERLEIRALRSTGEEFPAEASIAKSEGPDGMVLTVVLRDVTERKQAREELAKRERQLAEAQKIAHLGSWSWDVVADVVEWSDELYRIYGLEVGSPIDFAMFAVRVHPEDREMVRSRVEQALDDGGAFEFQHRIVRPDGEVRWVHGRGEVVLDAEGRAVRLTGTGQDITELRHANAKARRLAVEQAARQAAQQAERRMAFLARVSAELARSLEYEATLSTVAQLAVPELADWCAVDLTDEDGSLRRLAVAHDDPDGAEVVRRIDADYPPDPDARHGVPEVIRTGVAEIMSYIPDEFLVQAAVDDQHLELLRSLHLSSYIVAPLSVGGRVLGAISFATAESGRRYDGDDLRLVEDLARRAAVAIDNARLVRELARAVQAKTDFMATVSHELRTPLNAIMGYTELLEAGIPAPIPEVARTYAHRIGLSAKHLLQLIDEILTFSRLQADREVVDHGVVEISELLDEIQAIIGPLVDAKGLAFRIATDGAPDQVTTDPRKLRQIVLNLLGNAVKFTDSGGVDLRLALDGGHLLISVIDSGPGIPSEEQPLLFEPFWQSDQSPTRVLGGAGLGLAISDRFARLLGGEITVESEPGEGSNFTLRIPTTPAPPA
jgi:PAS domain S-box-containing protein